MDGVQDSFESTGPGHRLADGEDDADGLRARFQLRFQLLGLGKAEGQAVNEPGGLQGFIEKGCHGAEAEGVEHVIVTDAEVVSRDEQELERLVEPLFQRGIGEETRQQERQQEQVHFISVLEARKTMGQPISSGSGCGARPPLPAGRSGEQGRRPPCMPRWR